MYCLTEKSTEQKYEEVEDTVVVYLKKKVDGLSYCIWLVYGSSLISNDVDEEEKRF